MLMLIMHCFSLITVPSLNDLVFSIPNRNNRFYSTNYCRIDKNSGPVFSFLFHLFRLHFYLFIHKILYKIITIRTQLKYNKSMTNKFI